jgi:hypothetical protein
MNDRTHEATETTEAGTGALLWILVGLPFVMIWMHGFLEIVSDVARSLA